MSDTPLQQPLESWPRRWWRHLFTALEAVEKSGFEVQADRIDYLEERVKRLEALHAPPQVK